MKLTLARTVSPQRTAKLFVKAFTMVSLFTGLTACGWLTGPEGFFRDRSGDYRNVSAEPDLKVPEQTPSNQIVDLLVVPETDQQLKKNDESGFKAPMPPRIGAHQNENLIRVQKLGDQRWMLVNLPPEKLWPRIRDFLLVNRVPLIQEKAESGLLETNWLLYDQDETVRERYRFVIEQGVQRETAEIHILQSQQARSESAEATWPQASINAKREKWMIDQVADFLINTASRPSVSLLAQGLSGEPKLSFSKVNNDPKLLLQLPYNRAWASVAHGLKKAEFKINDVNRDAGYLLVTYLPAPSDKDQPGMFARAFGAEPAEFANIAFAGQQFKILVEQPLSNKVQISTIRAERVLNDTEQNAQAKKQSAEESGDEMLKPLTLEQEEAVLKLFKGYLS